MLSVVLNCQRELTRNRKEYLSTNERTRYTQGKEKIYRDADPKEMPEHVGSRELFNRNAPGSRQPTTDLPVAALLVYVLFPLAAIGDTFEDDPKPLEIYGFQDPPVDPEIIHIFSLIFIERGGHREDR